MDLTRLVSGTAWVPLLSGCMMWGGMGHTSGADWRGEAGHATSGQLPQPLQRAEASSDGITLTLWFPTSSSGSVVAIDARLFAEDPDPEPIAGDIRLRIQTPSGAVDQLRMQRLDSSPEGAYRAHYSFPVPGVYVVTAEARTARELGERTVSLTARTPVYDHPGGGRHQWLMPGAILGGLGMVAMMVLMMGGAWF